MLERPWNFRKHKPLKLKRINRSTICLHVVGIEDEEIGNQTKMADAKPRRTYVTGNHATVVMETGNQAQNAAIVVMISPIVEEKHPASWRKNILPCLSSHLPKLWKIEPL